MLSSIQSCRYWKEKNPDITDVVTKASFNTKAKDIANKMPDITNLPFHAKWLEQSKRISVNLGKTS